MKRLYIITCFFIIPFAQSLAQKQLPCGTPANVSDPLAHLDQNIMRQNADGLKIVRLYVINFDNTTTFNPESIWEEVRLMNQQFRPYNVCLELLGFRTLYDGDLGVFNIEKSFQKLTSYAIPNTLTMFVHYAVFKNSNEELAGSAFNIPNMFFSVASNTFGGRMTAAHEAGHCLGLFHTFHGNPGVEDGNGTCQEFVNGTNSASCGDFVSDTPADPYGLTGATVTTNCTYNGTTKDPKGASYSPSLRNTMSYWRVDNDNCTRNGFTAGQGDRMHSTLTFPQALWPTVITEINGTYEGGTFTDVRRITATTGTITAGNFGNGNFELRNSWGGFTAKKIVLAPGFRSYVSDDDRSFIIKPVQCQ